MKKWLLHITYIAVLGLLTVSCSNYLDEDASSADGDKISVTFTLAMNASSSRAIPIGSDDGNSYENRIDADGLQVLFYSNSAYIGKVKNIMAVKVEDSKNIYTFVGNLEISEGVENYTLPSCKVMVFANTADVDGETDLAGLTFDYDAAAFKNETVNIPMWGVKSYTSLKLTPGSRTDLETIYLLRAMAKVEVTMSDEAAQEFNLTGVTLNKYNEKGYCLPSDIEDYVTDGFVANDANYLFNPFLLPSSSQEPVDFKSVNNTNDHVLYLPEWENNDNSAYMTVSLTNKVDGLAVKLNAPELYFKDYSIVNDEDSRFDIVRNQYYKYIINKVDRVEGKLYYTVENWDEASIDIPAFN